MSECVLVQKKESVLPKEDFENLESIKQFSTPPPVIFAGSPSAKISTYHTQNRSGKSHYSLNKLTPLHYSQAHNDLTPDTGKFDESTFFSVEHMGSLKHQVKQLEAALEHSLSRQRLLEVSLDETKAELNEKQTLLTNKQLLLEAIEEEHRKIKSNFRDLLEETLVTTKTEGDLENKDLSENDSGLCDAYTGSQYRFQMHGTQDKLGKPDDTYLARSSNLIAEDEQKHEIHKEKFQQEQQSLELVESLRGTMEYAQHVLQRNTLLEEKCNQLETTYSERLKELYEELEFVRQQRLDAEARLNETSRNLDFTKTELGELHNELLLLHQQIKSTNASTAELQDTKEEIKKLETTISTLELEKKCLEEEISTHKQLLASERESLRSYMENAKSNFSTDVLSSRILELEETIKSERTISEEKIKNLETELTKFKHESQELKLELSVMLKNENEKEEEVIRLTMKHEKLTKELEIITKQDSIIQEKLAEFEKVCSELNETKKLLETEKEKNQDLVASLQKQLELVKESNQRFLELSEKHSALDLLLQQQEKQRERILNENIETTQNMHTKIKFFREQKESLQNELDSTKKELTKATEFLKMKEQEFQIEKLRELRSIKQEHQNEQRALLKRFELDMMRLRTEHEKDLNDLREQRQEKLDSMAEHYEKVIQEMKTVYEKNLSDVLAEKKLELEEKEKSYQFGLNDLRSKLQDQLQQERDSHENELSTLIAHHQQNLQNTLKLKSDELSEVKHQFDSFKTNSEQERLLNKAQIEDLKQQLRILKSKDNIILTPRQSDNKLTSSLVDPLKLKEELESLRAEYSDYKNQQRVKHREVVETAERKIQLVQHKYEATQKDNEVLTEKLSKKNQEVQKLEENYKEQIETLEKEKQNLIEDLEVKRQHDKKANLTSTDEEAGEEILSASYQMNRIETLTGKLQELQEASLQLEKRLEFEQSFYKSQLEEKDQRINFLLMTKDHIQQVMERNSELEQEFSEFKQKTQDLIEEKTKNLNNNVDELFKTTKLLDDSNRSNSVLQASCKELQEEVEYLKKKVENYKLQADEITELNFKVSELLDETLDLRKQLSSYQKQQQHSGVGVQTLSTTSLESLRQLNDQLVASRNEIECLYKELESSRSQLIEKSEASLEVVSLKGKLQANEKLIEFLKQKLTSHESLIKELTLNENERTTNSSATAGLKNKGNVDVLHEFSKRVEDLSKQCFDLTEQKLMYEQEKRTLLHRMELEKQVLSQCIEQKDRQLRQLLETNKRAEKLFARNAEVEELLLSLTRQLDQLRQQQATKSTYSDTPSVNTVSYSQEQQFIKSTEIETLRNLLSDRESYIQQLNTKLRDFQTLHTREVEELNNKLRSTMLELELNSTENDADVLKLLVEKTAELQKEVARLHRERDASYELIQAEKEALKNIVSTSVRSITKQKMTSTETQDTTSLLSEISILQQRNEQLLIERLNLQQQLQNLLEESDCTKKTEESRTEVIELEKKNSNLQKTIKLLLKRLREHKSTLNFVIEHANKAVRQTTTLDELTERLNLETEDRELLNSLHEKTIELQTVLDTVNNWIGTMSSESDQQLHKEDELNATGFSSVVNSFQNNLKKVWSRVSLFSHDDRDEKNYNSTANANLVTTPYQQGLLTPLSTRVHETSPVTDHSLMACGSDVPTNVPEEAVLTNERRSNRFSLFESGSKSYGENYWKSSDYSQINKTKERKAKRARVETQDNPKSTEESEQENSN